LLEDEAFRRSMMITREKLVVRTAVAVAIVGLLTVTSATVGSAQAGPTVEVDSGAPTVVHEVDGTYTYSATMTLNDSGRAMGITVGASDPTCHPNQYPILEPGVATKVKLTFPAACHLDTVDTLAIMVIPFENMAGASTGVVVQPNVTPASDDPKYGNMLAGYAFPLVLSIVFAVLAWWRHKRIVREAKDNKHAVESIAVQQRFPGLDKKWTWSDSPLANVTLAAAVVTGVLGATSPVERILGDEGKNQATVIIVAAALTAALVASAPVILELGRNEIYNEKRSTVSAALNSYTPLGLLAAATVVLTASLGLVLTSSITLWKDSPVGSWAIFLSDLLVTALVLAFAWRSTQRTLLVGVTKPIVQPPTLPPVNAPVAVDETDDVSRIVVRPTVEQRRTAGVL